MDDTTCCKLANYIKLMSKKCEDGIMCMLFFYHKVYDVLFIIAIVVLRERMTKCVFTDNIWWEADISREKIKKRPYSLDYFVIFVVL